MCFFVYKGKPEEYGEYYELFTTLDKRNSATASFLRLEIANILSKVKSNIPKWPTDRKLSTETPRNRGKMVTK